MDTEVRQLHDAPNPEFERQKSILLDGLRELSAVERKAIFLRFWFPSTIAQIATELRVSWDVADQIINGAIIKLRGHFANENIFYMNRRDNS